MDSEAKKLGMRSEPTTVVREERKQHVQVQKMGWGVRHIQSVCMCVCITSLLMVRSSMGVAVLAMTDERRKSEGIKIYDWDKKTQGVVLSSFFWGYLMMQIPAGLLSKRFGGKPILLVALLTNGLICVLVPTLAKLGGWKAVCAARMATGLTQACTFPASHTLLGRWLPDQERVMLSGVVYGGTQLGTILGMPVSGMLANTKFGWPLVFYAMATLMIITAVLWYYMTASSPAKHRLMTYEEQCYIEKNLQTCDENFRVPTPWRQILTSRPVWGIVAAHVGTTYGFVLFFVDMPTYMEKGLNISLRDSASLSALPYIGMWMCGMMTSAICERLYNKGILTALASRRIFNSIGGIGNAIGLIGLACTTNTHMAIVWLVITNTISGAYYAGFMVNHLDLSPNFAGVLLSLTNFIASIGSVATPILTSFILKNDPTDLSRWRIVFLVAALVVVVSNIIYVTFCTTERQPWDDPYFRDKRVADPEEMEPVYKKKKREVY